MAESKVVYRPRDGATPESELSALVAAYRYVIFDCCASERGRLLDKSGPDDAEGFNYDRTATQIIPEPS